MSGPFCPHGGNAFACHHCFRCILCDAIKEVIELLDATTGELAECPDLLKFRQSQSAAVGSFSGARLSAGNESSGEIERRLR